MTRPITIFAAPHDDLRMLDAEVARALGSATWRLHRDLGERVDPAVIEILLTERYVELAERARITKYLPLLAERSVRRELRARWPGADG